MINPLKMHVNINIQPINFELDTMSGITLISKTIFFEKLSNYELSQTKITIKT